MMILFSNRGRAAFAQLKVWAESICPAVSDCSQMKQSFPDLPNFKPHSVPGDNEYRKHCVKQNTFAKSMTNLLNSFPRKKMFSKNHLELF